MILGALVANYPWRLFTLLVLAHSLDLHASMGDIHAYYLSQHISIIIKKNIFSIYLHYKIKTGIKEEPNILVSDLKSLKQS